MPVHVYFKRNSEHWGILDFLNKSTEEPFKLKIDTYLKSLELIMNSEQGKRCDKAKLLYDDYKKEPRSDKKKAIDWDKERSRNQVHIHQQISGIIGAELANKFSSVRDINPEIWTPDLEKYIDNVLKKSGKQFKNATLVDVPDDLFRLYCEKVFLDFYNLVDINPTMDKKIGERKYITYQISSIYKYYERTFFNLDFDWIESHARSARITKSVTNSGIVKVDSIATRHYDGLSIWHMEVAGGPCNATDTHTLGDTKKTLRMDVLNLIAILRNHFDCSVELATKIKVFCTQVVGTRMTLYALSMLPDGRFISSELATAVVPFSFHGRNQFKAIFRMMAIFHNEITKQEELMGEIDRVVLRSKGTTVRHVLKIPEGLFDINAQIDAVLRYAQLVHFPYSIND
ncbi:hypothetical protein GLOIN_2v1693707 [Rhizophagus irregularis DAOM 181602=DAOM 197198]|nr:hypothetical protein GLOIN_2v1693707 [Rhizophagus irregularis DAOM 181602=DAOM 197198]